MGFLMKRLAFFSIALFALLFFPACAPKQVADLPEGDGLWFHAKVIEVYEGGCILEPLPDAEAVLASADRLLLGDAVLQENGISGLSAGDLLLIAYDGMILESYPAQLSVVYSVSLLDENGEALRARETVE